MINKDKLNKIAYYLVPFVGASVATAFVFAVSFLGEITLLGSFVALEACFLLSGYVTMAMLPKKDAGE